MCRHRDVHNERGCAGKRRERNWPGLVTSAAIRAAGSDSAVDQCHTTGWWNMHALRAGLVLGETEDHNKVAYAAWRALITTGHRNT